MSVRTQQSERRALIERLAAAFFSPAIRAAQLARLDAITDPRCREHAPAQAQQHHHVSS